MKNLGTVAIIVKINYGQKKYYPGNPLASQFADLLGTKTISLDQLKKIEAMGFLISDVTPREF